ncbi:GumC family protein [Bosea sp. (in: a-proteobacteria)]|uniref:GumC family protein n=1 Tax=Bosea sp. (in: a-proteobacteria) TaxID=1871050 RepID=UPI003FA5F475
MYGPKESEQRQTPRPIGQHRGPRAAADFVVASDGTAVAGKSPLARLGMLGRVGVDDVLDWLRAGIGWIIGAIILCLVAALFYAVTTPPRYTVYTDILIDPSNLNVVRDDVFTSNPQRDAQLLEVESKLRILTSRNVLSRVIDKLDLTNDPEFVKPGLLSPLWNLISPKEVARDNRLAVMRALAERVEARREERSFVVVMRFWAEEPERAVTISNAIVDAFETELFQSSAESAGRVVKNLNNRLDEMRRNVTEAEQRVEDFRRSKGLQLNNGEPVSARLSSELNTQVLEAQQRFIQAETRYKQMSAAIAERRAASASVFDSATMVSLRAQLNTLQQQIGSIRATFGTRHPQMVTALSEQQAVEGALTREARRIFDGAKAEFERERSTLAMLRGKAGDEKSNVFSDNEEQVQLRDLQRDARAKATLYETHLARTQQIGERQQIDTSNVRVISRPLPPKARSWPPRTLILLGVAVFFGLFLGIAIALARGAWRYLREPRLATA